MNRKPDTYRLLCGAPVGGQVARTNVLGTTTWLVMEAATTVRKGLPGRRDAVLEDMEAILNT